MASYNESTEFLRTFTAQANRYPMLLPEQEAQLARDWADRQDRRAFDKLVQSHMRLAVKVAGKYARSGLPIADLVSEANIGLIKAVQRFDPTRGFRLATYALWWIRAEVQSFVLHNWSLLKGGNTATLKRLFFNLRQTQRKLGIHDRVMSDAEAQRVAETLSASVEDVREMEHRFATPVGSLNVPVGEDGDHEAIDLLADDTESVEERLVDRGELTARRALMKDALTQLGERERHIFAARNLSDQPVTLETLARHYGVSKERIRQIESGAYKKVVRRVRSHAETTPLLPPMALGRRAGLMAMA
ncbi:RNA polymerase factor sigma-32 [Niveispirillum sp.]|uniref:RNA polymerase factor sigma-32 n=1 Tax=Niveispirillum sp. TaxID=1917217 RepID=UPI001B56D8BF|nr:RNA polymerase factor sigma-32 [Niveispirillum sp.]MBP7338777.1 RNA polymerase factor sigma-32 [Niveispirillum sp.]